MTDLKLNNAFINYGRFSLVDLSMTYFMAEDELFSGSEEEMALSRFIRETIDNLANKVTSKESIDDIRSRIENITKKAGVASNLNEIASLYAMVIERVRGRFDGCYIPPDYSDENMAESATRFIFSDEDGLNIHTRLTGIMWQLPVRYSKTKFFSILDEVFDTYVKNGITDRDMYRQITNLKYLSIPDVTDEMEQQFPELSKDAKMLLSFDFSDITEEDFRKADEICERVRGESEKIFSGYAEIAGILQKVLSFSLCLYHADDKDLILEYDKVKPAVEILKLLSSENEGAEEAFEAIEGVPEELLDKINRQMHPDEIKENMIKSGTYTDNLEAADDLITVSGICEGQTFFEDGEFEDRGLDAREINRYKETLIEDYKNIFSQHDNIVNHSMMGAALTQLPPVLFKKAADVKEFILSSLSGCRDVSVKSAAIVGLTSEINDTW